MQFIALLCFLSALIAANGKLLQSPNCGVTKDSNRLAEHPWTVQLYYEKADKDLHRSCGGTLIGDRYVLTAATCIMKAPKSWKLKFVRIGEWDTSKDIDCDSNEVCNPAHKDIPVEASYVREDYEVLGKEQHNDLALLKLSESVEFSKTVQPICLPVVDALSNYTDMELVGWGRRPTMTLKTKHAMKEFSNEACGETYRKHDRTIINEQICADAVIQSTDW